MNSAGATENIRGNLRSLCTSRDSNQPPSQYQSEALPRWIVHKEQRSNYSTIVDDTGHDRRTKRCRDIVILLGVIHIKYRLAMVGTAGPRVSPSAMR
jgi:hypothetical protein